MDRAGPLQTGADVTVPFRSPFPECPYPGLVGYGPEEASCFFGRDVEVEELLGEAANALYGWVPLVLVGESGVGKSSLLRAGLLAGVENGGLDTSGSDRWPHLVMAPGSEPLIAFSRGLAEIIEESGLDLPVLTRPAGPGQVGPAVKALVSALDEAVGTEGSRLVLVIDQAEELFTQCDAVDRDAFRDLVDELCRPARAADGRQPW